MSKLLYEIIYEEQKSKIMSGDYDDGEKLPFERELCTQYKVDRITVRRALEMLVDDGLLIKRQGIGSFAKRPLVGKQTDIKFSRNILFVMLRTPTAYNFELFYAISQECQKNNYSLVYAELDEKFDLNDLANGKQTAGILFVGCIPDDILNLCAEMHFPAICINNRHNKLISVVPENESGAYDAVSHLLTLGHRRIAILTGLENHYSTKERLHGFYAAMASMQIGVDPNLVIHGDWTFSGAREAILTMIENIAPDMLPTAIFCMSDIMALGAMNALHERGIHVPKQISVMGFDNIQQSNYVSPRLTTIAVDLNLMAKLVVEVISKVIINFPDISYSVQIPISLEKRQSVAPFVNAPSYKNHNI